MTASAQAPAARVAPPPVPPPTGSGEVSTSPQLTTFTVVSAVSGQGLGHAAHRRRSLRFCNPAPRLLSV